MNRLRVSPPSPPPADYDVMVEAGALARLPALIRETAPAHRYALVTDANVAPLLGERLARDLAAAGLPVELLVVPAGEAAKTRETWATLLDELLARRFGRDSCILALGGGVLGDLAGFVAATFLRGVPVVQLPTTLLAMLDASVGGKTGVDTPAGKNLVGAFHHPRLVVMDPETLATLPALELRSGLAEAVKHGAIADAAYLERIVAEAQRIRARDADALARLVRRSVEIKAEFVAADPYEQGARKALNFGHTIGHALEALSRYTLPHGFAVGLGMLVEASAGEAAGITQPGTADALEEALERLELPTVLPEGTDADAVLEAARLDKKARASTVRYALVARIGEVARGPEGEWALPLSDEVVRAAIVASAQRSGQSGGI